MDDCDLKRYSTNQSIEDCDKSLLNGTFPNGLNEDSIELTETISLKSKIFIKF